MLVIATNITDVKATRGDAEILGALIYTDLTVKYDGETVREVLSDLKDELGILAQPYWETKNIEGLNPLTNIQLVLDKQPAIVILERIIEQLGQVEASTWQIRNGVLEIGLKSRFARRVAQRLVVYPIEDLLFTVRNFDNAPEMGTGGNSGGGNSGGFGFGTPTENPERISNEEMIQEIVRLIKKFIEPDMWDENGGECTIDTYKEVLLIRAPNFIHRQIGGYLFEPIRPDGVKTRSAEYTNGRTNVRIYGQPKK